MPSCSAFCLIIITLFIPPLGVFLIAGCGADLLINILLTILGYFPGHIHAFYLEYVYYHRRGLAAAGGLPYARPATGVYSERIQNGGHHHHHHRQQQQQQQYAPVQPQPQPQPQTQYGTIRT